MLAREAFGRTGHMSSRVIFGAAALSRVSQARADEILPILLRYGVNHIDTAATYGESELRIAPWLKEHRSQFFLASKTGDRGASEARASLERTLVRLGVDQLDLIQLHNLVEEDEFSVAHGRDGAVAAMVRAREEGLVRFIGVTGHGLRIARMHLRSLERFSFDSVLLPYNYALLGDEHYRRDVEALLEVCSAQEVAVQTIKALARRRWIEPQPSDQRRSWYQPLQDRAAIERATNFVLSNEQLFLNSSSDYELLENTLEVASQPRSVPTDEQLAADIAAHEMAPLFDGAELERI